MTEDKYTEVLWRMDGGIDGFSCCDVDFIHEICHVNLIIIATLVSKWNLLSLLLALILLERSNGLSWRHR